MKKRSLVAHWIFSCILICNGFVTAAQERIITLEEAVMLAQRHSFEYKVALNSHQSSVWSYRNYIASFRPILYLDGTIPNYSRAINKITLPSGEDTFVLQNQAYSTLNLGIRQNLAITGGVLSVASSLNRIDVFGSNRQSMYSSVPISISYYQNTIGYNPFKWQKKIEPLRFELADKKFVSQMEEISRQTVNKYFQLLNAQTRTQLSRQNLAKADTLYGISKERHKMGTVGQSELLQLRLNVLNAQNQVTQDSVDAVLDRQQFARYLLLDLDTGWQLEVPDKVSFFEVGFDDALTKAYSNSEQVMEFRLQRLEAEQRVAQAKAENSLKFNVQANFGLSNTAPSFPSLFNRMENQQNVLVGFSLPILDWGLAKTERLRAEANQAMVESQIEQNQLQLEQEISLYVARWNLHRQQMEVARETQAIALQNYDLEVERLLRGMISINDLNAAQIQKDNATSAYIDALRAYWELYFIIRKLTLYDFKNNKNLKYNLHNDQ
ncbi:TolC family protein [Parapedobacter sp. 10938]|uniref:TolC family protein n=1 Tax=Parapedobacter flavus TaxID=3110225 RepID=UPI002DBA7077|nr:TolC family protein [Parapedobacter sp. 10938]MEC3881792.1 TolC family protein [Parapedobacter sp. 10938]